MFDQLTFGCTLLLEIHFFRIEMFSLERNIQFQSLMIFFLNILIFCRSSEKMKINCFHVKKVKSSMAMGLSKENLQPQNVGSVINYLEQFTEVIYWSNFVVQKYGNPCCSRPQLATDNGVRDGKSNWLVAPSTLHRAVPPELHVFHRAMMATNHKTCCTQWAANVRPSECHVNALPMRPLRAAH